MRMYMYVCVQYILTYVRVYKVRTYVFAQEAIILLYFIQCNNAEVALEDRETTLFYYVHTLYKMVARKEPMKKIWDQSYTLVYQERQESKEGLPQVRPTLRLHILTGAYFSEISLKFCNLSAH